MRKKILAMLLAAVTVMALLPTAFAADTSGTCGDNVRWSYSDGTLTIEGTGPMDNYHRDFPFLVPWYNYSDEIHTVTIGSGVTAIGEYAFTYYNHITGVTIPASVTSIGKYAFAYCRSLTGVTIPDGVITIESSAFEGCESLTRVTLPISVASIWSGAFICESLKDVYYGGSESQWNQISIEWGNESLTDANIIYNSSGPDTTEPIGPETPAEPTQPETPEITFNDVPAGSWYASAISFAVGRNLLEGDGKGNFNPNDKLTRAQTFAILARLDGKTITGDNWIETATQWAVGKDVSTGENPGSDVTREQLVVMLWRYADEPGADTSVLSDYPDRAGLHDWGETAMAWAVAAKIVEGDGGKLMPQGTADRAQAVTVIQRYCENLEALSGGGKG